MPNGNGNGAFLGQFMTYRAFITIMTGLAGAAITILALLATTYTSRPHEDAALKPDMLQMKKELQHDLEAMEERLMKRIERMEEKIDK